MSTTRCRQAATGAAGYWQSELPGGSLLLFANVPASGNYWTDVLRASLLAAAGMLQRRSVRSGRDLGGNQSGAVCERQAGRAGKRPRGAVDKLCDVEGGNLRTRIKDGSPTLLVGCRLEPWRNAAAPSTLGALYCRTTDGLLTKVRAGIGIPNAIATSPDGSTFYFATWLRRRSRPMIWIPSGPLGRSCRGWTY